MATFLNFIKLFLSYDNGSLLVSAINHNSPALVEFLLKNKANPNISDPDIPLCLAAKNNFLDIGRILLKYKASPNQEYYSGPSPLEIALTNNNRDFVKLLISYNVDVNRSMRSNILPLEHVMQARDQELIALILPKTYINAVGHDELTPLARAIKNHNFASVKTLLDVNADIEIPLTDDNVALHLAAEAGDCKIIQALLDKGANIHLMTLKQKIPLYIACECGNFDAVRLLLNSRLKKPVSEQEKNEVDIAVTYAISGQKLPIVQLLFAYGANLNYQNDQGCSYLHLAAVTNCPSIVEYFISRGINVNDTELQYGASPLHFACMQGNSEVVSLLLNHRADANIATDSTSYTPLHFAIRNGHNQLIKIVLSHPLCNLSKENKEGLLQYAINVCNFKACETLVRFKTPLCLKNLTSAIQLYNEYSAPTDIARLKQLIKFGAYKLSNKLSQNDLNIIMRGFPYFLEISPLFMQTKKGDFSSIDSCLAKGFDINTYDENYETLLHHAVAHRNKTIIKKLLGLGADPTVTNKNGLNPIQLASSLPDLDIVKMFVRATTPMAQVYSKYPQYLAKEANNREILTAYLKRQTCAINCYLDSIKTFNNIKADTLSQAKRVGIFFGSLAGSCLGAYTLLRCYQTYKTSGLRQALKSHWLKGLGSIAAGGLAYLAASKLTWTFKRKPLAKLKQKLESEKNSISQRLAKLKDTIKPCSEDTQELASNKNELLEAIKNMELT